MIPIYKPYMPENLITGINEILYSGQLGFGKYGKQFESQLKEFIGCNYILTINSYNTAMQVVLSTLGLQFGDEVIASPVSCLASNQPFATKGLKVIWADINHETGTLCPTDVESKITKNTKAIFHNHFCGYVGDITAINTLGEKYGIPIIDDGIEAFGAEYKGERLGNVGTDLTVFSFQTVRLPNTIEGGAIVFKDKALYDKAVLIRDYGIDRSQFRTADGEINPDCDIQLEGYGGLMSEVNSFIGTKQMLGIDQLLKKQQQNAIKWQNELQNNIEVSPLVIMKDSQPNYWVFGTLSENSKETIAYFKSRGYYATGVHINNNIYSVFNNKINLVGVNKFKQQFVAIPCGWWFDWMKK
ncbi:DegT/DnrJ/EryC1/StrS family aminotransferase [Flavobacterium muglaense]|uniref:DegT/DnrJ/EryC1/StrS aminotransferase family protein n=1 Tax=Flavobacterium muglaense TaxID=2764716 RepID=A0A923SEI9_9FLAO|nr:DegT/DnrJ/EryC1/StrS aminotransferase family protein [Flavobacterium muglaense]MBC5837037.1 DegT/DnrJ/EryC1/StrS aminotransferase family protein [Flavobacterium muglaense]MBC5843566.1 DegT/DnrJ/EryC1/StrS aminotransferase family protein [Flavobacterium muglaense]